MLRTLGVVVIALLSGCSGSRASSPSPDAENSFAWVEAAPCPVPRFEALGAVVDNELWVMGGFLSSKLDVTPRIDIYDPASGSWRVGPELPGAETHAGVAVVGSDVLLVGGFAGNVLERATTPQVWRWNAAASVWSAGPDLPTPRAAVAMALVGTEVHAAGGLAADGNSDSAEHVVWDLAGSNDWMSAPPLAVARNHGGGAASLGLFFAVSGRHGWDEVTGDDPALEAFDPLTDTWHTRAPLPSARSEIGASTLVLSDGRLLVVGGSVAGRHPSEELLVYSPLSDSWSTLPALPQALKGAVAARVDHKIIVTTGSRTSTDPSATTFVGCCL